jgi:hypothetical protein
VFCVECFSNDGIRAEAARIAVADGVACKNCGSMSPRLTTVEQVDELVHVFFVHGSTAPAGRWGPILKMSSGKLPSKREPAFDKTLRRDYVLLRRAGSGTLFRKAPSTWRLGYTTIADHVETAITAAVRPTESSAVVRLFDRLIDHCVSGVIPMGRRIYRLRRNIDLPFDVSQFDAPPTNVTSPTRFSDESWPLLYGAFDVETCLHECRVLAEHSPTLATLVPTRELRVVDLTDVPYDAADASGGEGGDLFYCISARIVFASRSRLSQIFGQRSRERGFDGIVYPSFFSDVRPNRERHPNIVLFGNPLRDGIVTLRSLNHLRLNMIRMSLRLARSSSHLPRRIWRSL